MIEVAAEMRLRLYIGRRFVRFGPALVRLGERHERR